MIGYILLYILFIQSLEKSDVYFTKVISSSKVLEMFQKLNIKLTGKIALKVHTGERNGPYYLRPSFLKNIYDYTNGTFIESNAAYTGSRHTTELHKQLLQTNGWSEYRTIIMDENELNDDILPVNNYKDISENIVGEHLSEFDSCIVLSHFKGHSMGGFGGALKQLSIGFASRAGKSNIHTSGYTKDYKSLWSHTSSQNKFTTAMADAASTIVENFENKGGIAYINILANISKSCDCAGSSAPTPKIRDIGILSSLDPVAIDKACYDLIEKENNDGSKDWLRQAESLLGLNTLEKAAEHGIGSLDYNLINVDGDEDNNNDKDDDNNNNESNDNDNESENDDEPIETFKNKGNYNNMKYWMIPALILII